MSSPAPPTVSPDQPVPAEFDLLCESCGYSLIGLMVDRCPECGQGFDAAQLPLARVPWLYRKRLGRIAAYVQTLRLALWSPRAFTAELCRPVRISERDAHRFRMLTIRLGTLATVLGVAGYLHYVVGFWPPRLSTALLVVACLGTWVATFVFLRLATDLPTFIWRGLPGRSHDLSPLHQYACAPLALLLPASAAFVAAMFVLQPKVVAGDQLTVAGTIALLALGGSIVLYTWVTALVFMRTASGCRARRVALLGLYLPVHWLMMLSLVLMAVLAVVLYTSAWLD